MAAVQEYIDHLLSLEEYAFSWEELLQKTDAPVSTLRKELDRLTGRNELFNLRKGFYLILPPLYRPMGKLPVSLYADKLFAYLGKPYYLAFYSAAMYHGAAHQQIQQDYIMTAPPALRDINKGNARIRFFTATHWPERNLMRRTSDAGAFYLSSPALTMADLLYHQRWLGGINRMLANLEELSEELSVNDIRNLLAWYPHKSTLQRLGFILEEVGADSSLTEPITDYLQRHRYFPALLSPRPDEKPGSTGNAWKIDVNVELASDL
ncbi:MAG: type IV toxin-antitoxin system AbiEi family antitoxin [Lewinellaceae bacterium]|nr:type IV toxin-antitoxin system AbiEi family antitoxin [Lewinellaceae bacterium]